MKRSKRQMRQLLILCLVLVLVAAGYFTAVAINKAAEKRSAEENKKTEIVISSLADVVSMEVHNRNGTFLLSRDAAGEWQLDNYADFPMRPTKITYITFDLTPLKGERKIALTESPESYGFGEGCTSVKATDSMGVTVDLLVGSPTGYKYYYMLRGGDTVYIAGSTLAEDLEFTLMDIAQPYSFHEMSEQSLLNVRYTTGGHTYYVDKDVGYDEAGQVAYTFYISVDGGKRYAFEGLQFAENVVIDTEKGWYFRRGLGCLDVFLNMWEDFYTHNCIAYQPTSEQLEEYGLTREKAEAVVEMDYTWKNVDYHYTLYIGNLIPDENGSTESGEFRYAWIEGRSVLETAAAADLDAFRLLYETIPQGFAD